MVVAAAGLGLAAYSEYQRQRERRQDRSDNKSYAAQSRADAQALNAQNLASQKEFAKHGVAWKVADARQAGISPLAALGSSANFSPVGAVGSFAKQQSNSPIPIGQNLSRAARAGSTSAIQQEMDALAIQNAKLQNQLLEGQVNNLNTQTAVTATSLPDAKPTELQATMTQPSRQTNATIVPTVPEGAKLLDTNEALYGEGGSLALGGINIVRAIHQAMRNQLKHKPKKVYPKHRNNPHFNR